LAWLAGLAWLAEQQKTISAIFCGLKAVTFSNVFLRFSAGKNRQGWQG